MRVSGSFFWTCWVSSAKRVETYIWLIIVGIIVDE